MHPPTDYDAIVLCLIQAHRGHWFCSNPPICLYSAQLTWF